MYRKKGGNIKKQKLL